MNSHAQLFLSLVLVGQFLILFHVQVQYKKDCEETFGRILDNHNVISSLQAKSKHEMSEKWSKLYPEEPFELDCSGTFSEESFNKYPGAAALAFTYDLVSAVKRQSSFCYQVAPLVSFFPFTADIQGFMVIDILYLSKCKKRE